MRFAQDLLISVAIGTFSDFLAKGIQIWIGGTYWLPDGHEAFAWAAAAYWFSRYPIWERR